MTSEEEPPLRFGCLEAFVAVAESLNYEVAGEKLGLHPTNVQRNVGQLEQWLRSILIVNDGPLELSDPWGVDFLPIAVEVLAIVGTSKDGSDDFIVPRQSPGRSFIDMADLDGFLAVGRWGNYDEAAFRLGIASGRLRRRVKALEGVLGISLIVGRSIVKIAPEAQAFAVSAARVVDLIRRHRQPLPAGYDPTEQAALQIYHSADRERKSIAAMVSIMENRKRLSREARKSLIDARIRIRFLDQVCSTVANKPASTPK